MMWRTYENCDGWGCGDCHQCLKSENTKNMSETIEYIRSLSTQELEELAFKDFQKSSTRKYYYEYNFSLFEEAVEHSRNIDDLNIEGYLVDAVSEHPYMVSMGFMSDSRGGNYDTLDFELNTPFPENFGVILTSTLRKWFFMVLPSILDYEEDSDNPFPEHSSKDLPIWDTETQKFIFWEENHAV